MKHVASRLHGFWHDRVEETVARAFQEVCRRDHRIAFKRIQIELQRTIDKAMDHQPMARWVYLRPPSMMNLKVKSARRNRAPKAMVRRP